MFKHQRKQGTLDTALQFATSNSGGGWQIAIDITPLGPFT